MSLLSMKNISKGFPGVKALNNVDLVLDSGEVIALLGENGAGKSTLIKILGGIYRRDQGDILLKGEEVDFTSPREALDKGIGIIHQELSLLQHLSIRENIFLGREKINPITKRIDWSYLDKQSTKILSDLGITDVDVTRPVGGFSVAIQQMVEIARVISMNCEIIVMDEPTDTLTTQETQFLFKVIRTLKESGKGIIYITHKLEDIFEIADKVQVLRDGRHVSTRIIRDTTPRELIQMMVGREVKEKYPKKKGDKGKAYLEVKDICVSGILSNVSFKAYEGEILGIAGLVGAGRTELAKTIFGVYKSTGQVFVEEKPVNISSPQDAINHGIVYITEDRKQEALFLDQEVNFNMTIAGIKDFVAGFGRIKKGRERVKVAQYIDKLSIKTPSQSQKVNNLSGGNQQKLLLARWIMTNPKALIFDEPTRGVDVGAKVEIYNLINELKLQGMAIIVISSELPEILGISDRVLVMHNGTITGEFASKEATQEKIMRCAVNL